MSATAFEPCRVPLPGGLTLLYQHNPVSSTVAITLTFAAGSIFDPPEHEGLATLVARGLPRGTSTRDKVAIGQVLDDRGAHLSGTAGRHTAGLVAKSRDVDFERLLELVFDCARGAQFPDDEVRKMRGDRLTALREDDDDPATIVARDIRPLLYPEGHPYARRHRGTVDSVEAMVADDLRTFRAEHLRPARGLLVVVGGVERARVEQEAARWAAGWHDGSDGESPGGLRAALPAVPDAPALGEVHERRVVLPDKIQSDIALGFPAIRRRDPRFHAAALLNSILGQFAMGGRLGRSVREEQGMAYYTYSSLDASIGPGPLLVRAGVAPDNVDRAVASIREELRHVREAPVTRQELDDARSATIRSVPRTLESNEGMAGLLHRLEMFNLGLDYLDRFAERFEAVTVEEVQEVARELIDPERYALVVAGPGVASEDDSGGS